MELPLVIIISFYVAAVVAACYFIIDILRG